MIPEPHRWISSTYTPPRNASTARPEEQRVVRAATPPRAAVFEWKKRRKKRFFAEKPPRGDRARALRRRHARFSPALERSGGGASRDRIFHAKRADTAT